MQQLLLALGPRPQPTLDNYVPGRNRAAVDALRALVAGSGDRVVYLWGEPGSGRSHLLKASVTAAQAAGLTSTVLVPGLPWTPPQGATLVAADDVDRLAAAEQIALFEVFIAVLAAGGAFLAAGSTAPAALALRPDLRTRLLSGLAFHLHALSDPEKAEALRRHAAGRGMRLDEDIVAYLLTRLPRDMSTQIAVVDALDQLSLERKRALTLPFVRDALKHLEP